MNTKRVSKKSVLMLKKPIVAEMGAALGSKFLFVSKAKGDDLADVEGKNPRYIQRLYGGIAVVWGYC